MITKERKAIQAKLRRKYGYETRAYNNGVSIIKPNVNPYIDPHVTVDMAVSVDWRSNPDLKIEISLTKYHKYGDKYKEEDRIDGMISLEELELIYKAAKEAVKENEK